MKDKELIREWIIFAYEFFFTALFVFCIQGSLASLIGIPLFAFCLGQICGPITGANFNPAIAIGRFVAEDDLRKNAPTLIANLAGQFLGALFGIMLVYTANANLALDNPTAYPNEMLVNLMPAPLMSIKGTFITEIIGTTFYTFFNVCNKYNKTAGTKSSVISGLGQNTVLFGVLITTHKSGCCLNPCVGLAFTIL